MIGCAASTSPVSAHAATDLAPRLAYEPTSAKSLATAFSAFSSSLVQSAITRFASVGVRVGTSRPSAYLRAHVPHAHAMRVPRCT